MDKAQAIQSFWEGFGLPAYDEQTVDPKAVMPYITYSVSTASFENVVVLNASIWYRTASWKEVSNKADEIARTIGTGCRLIKIEDGYLMLAQGTPFAQRMADPEDDMVRRIYLNLQAEFLTAY